jgi:hypothetical protein
VLAVTAVFFALWTVALKKTLTGGGSHSGNSPSAPVLQSAINKAKGLQSVVNSAAAKAGGTPTPTTTTTTPAATTPPTTSTPTTPTPTAKAATPAHKGAPAHAAASATSAPKHATGTAPVLRLPHSRPAPLAVVTKALQDHKVLAMLVYNPSASDDRAVNSELKSIPTHGGKVVKVSVRVQDLGSFSSLLNEVPVNFSPTLVLIDRNRQADEIAGFADSAEIAQRVDAALRSAPAKQSKQ